MKIIISTFATFVAAYIAATLAYKNSKKIKYYDEKRKIYYDLASILPIVDEIECQSDYLDGSEGCGNAEVKTKIMEIQLEDAEEHLAECKKRSGNLKKDEKIEIEISNLKYKIEKHKKYLKEFSELKHKIEYFKKDGKENLMRIFASIAVWNSYISLIVALSNEHNIDIGVTTEDIKYCINNLINNIRKDLN